MSSYPSQEMDRFNVRLPAGMRDAIAERAKRNGRSMNSEIVQILEDVLKKDVEIQIIDCGESDSSNGIYSIKDLESMFRRVVEDTIRETNKKPT